MKVLIQDMLFLGITAQRGLGGPDCAPSRFEWQPAATGTPARFYDDLCMRDAPNHPRPRVGWLVEAPLYAQCHYDWAVKHAAEFDCILTPCGDYAARGAPWRWYPRGGSMLPAAEWGVSPQDRRKMRSVSLLASAKSDATGHKLRHEIYERHGYRMGCHGGIVTGENESKLYALAPYRYTVVVDAERNNGCFCDHILDAMALGCVPIYWGCPDIGRWFDAEGVIQFETMDELGRILDSLSREDYAARLPALTENWRRAQAYRVPEDWLFDNYPDLFEGLT